MSKLLEQINTANKTNGSLASFVDLIGGGTPKTTVKEYWNGNIPWLSVVDFNNDSRWVGDAEKKITEEGVQNSSTRILEKDDIIISARGTVGAMAQLSRPMAFNQSCYGIRAKSGIDQSYLFYLLKSSIRKLTQIVHGAVFDTLTKDSFEQVEVSVPNLPTQKKIAEILSAYDSKIENNNKIIKNLEATAQTIFNEWFINFRFPGYEKVEMVESEFGEIPEEWGVGSLSGITHIIMGQSPTSNFYNEKKEGLPFHQGVTYFGDRYPNDVIYSTGGEKIAGEGDILISVRAPVGRINIASKKTIIGRGLSAIRSKNNQQCFLLYLLKNLFHKEDLFGGGSVFPSITKGEFEKLKVIVPDKDSTTLFDKKIARFDLEIKNLIYENENLKQSRDQLLAKLI